VYGATVRVQSVHGLRRRRRLRSAFAQRLSHPSPRSRTRLKVRHCDDGRCEDRIAWRWRRGVAQSVDDFGAPPAGDTLACGFATRDGATSLLFETVAAGDARCDGRACWRAGKDGVAWGPAGGALRRLRLRARSSRRSALEAVVAGPNLLQTAPRSGDLITVRIETADGACWSVASPAP
jgi:hypothetical protein